MAKPTANAGVNTQMATMIQVAAFGCQCLIMTSSAALLANTTSLLFLLPHFDLNAQRPSV